MVEAKRCQTPKNSPQILSFPSNFPVPSAMVCRGDLTSNWEFFTQQWQDYEVATSLDQKIQSIRLATFCLVMRKECLQIFLNLNCGTEELTINSALRALEDYFLPKKNVVYKRYVFNSCFQAPEESIDCYASRLRKAGHEKITVESDRKPLQSNFPKAILFAPCLLQRMMLRLQRFNLDVKYKPGAQMYVADHLS